MLQITTKSNAKLVEIDGLGYEVRRPGAGESLTMQKAWREAQRLNDLKERTDEQTARLGDLTMEVLGICLKLFKARDKKGEDYIQTLDVEVLMNVIEQLFGKEEAKNAETPAPAKTS